MKNYFSDEEIQELKKVDELSRAIKIVKKVFSDKVDLNGVIYTRHLLHVSASFNKRKEIIVALLHDLIEDTDFTLDNLLELGFDKETVESINLLSRPTDKTYNEYIQAIVNSDNLLVKKVKLVDLLDNMNVIRFTTPTDRDFTRILDRYLPSFTAILNDLKRRMS